MELVGAGRAKAAAGWLAGLALPGRTRCWKESARAATANSSLKPNSLLAGVYREFPVFWRKWDLAVFGRKWDQNCEAARLTKDQSVWWQCPSWDPCRPGESLVAFSRDPVLAVWQAMKPLAEIGARTDASDIAKIVTEAEIILFGLVRALSRRLE